MPRPAFKLNDDEARRLVAGVAEIEQLHPFNQRDHKPFVRAFIRLVHRITDRTFSPLVYRRLLNAFAPTRTPSTTTIALEKDRLLDELAREALAHEVPAGVQRESSSELERLLTSIAHQLQPGLQGGAAYLRKQCEFLMRRQQVTEKELSEAKSLASRARAERDAASALAERDRLEIESLRSNASAMAQEIARLATVVEDARRFSLIAIDESRAETRAWKERCLHAERQIKEQMARTEIFRQLAYRQGAAIPTILDEPNAE